MSPFRISFAAERDLDEIWLYIGEFDVDAADRWLDTMKDCFSVLAEQPFAGQSRTDLDLELRFFASGSYLIFYRPIACGVEIVRVIHGARDYRDERF